MSFTDHLETRALGLLFTGDAISRPTAWFAALFVSTTAPGDTGGGSEVSFVNTGYVRRPIAFSVAGNLATNIAAIEWPTATGDWGNITHMAVFDADTGGNMLVHAVLSASKNIASGDVLRIPAGDLDITLD